MVVPTSTLSLAVVAPELGKLLSSRTPPTPSLCLLLILRADRKSHDLAHDDRVRVRLRTQEGYQWFDGNIHTVVDDGICWVKYDDGDLLADYYDNREGSVKWKRI